MTLFNHTPILIALALLVQAANAGVASAAEPTPRPEDARFFEARVRPLLVEHCFKCHGPKKQKGGLRLDTPKGVRDGGGSGTPLLSPAKPDESLLLRVVRHAEGVEPMPPSGTLKASEIAVLAEWVKRGTPIPATPPRPGEVDPSKHWAFRPITRPAVPVVKDTDWARSDLDRFVLARLEAAGLKPAAPADKRTLIRRATFDLTGLPPRPDEVAAFLADESSGAFERVVDRLLASPAYGERWGRHWLDVARYADSNGLDENVAHGNAWRYRDYVIRAFNADKPFDRFLTEQIAGDLLPATSPAERNDHLIATGFLALGPKVLAEPDEKKMEFDIVDEQVDTLGRTVMGLTLGCARCHDHKFDPVTAADYYALAGIFVSTKTMETFTKVAKWHENPLAIPEQAAKKAKHDAAVADLKARIKALTGKKEEPAKTELKKLQAELAALEKSAPDAPAAMGVVDGKVVDVPILRRGNHLTPAAIVPRGFPVILAGEKQSPLPARESGRLELANWLTSPKHPLTARVFVNRVWRWHFGRGIVPSTDNFGLVGEKPSHPKLLDWLAAAFVRDGWSVKKLHKRVLLSATYRLSSTPDAKGRAVDPENRLLGHRDVQRLEAESIRDSLLAVSGLLDHRMGGSPLAGIKNRDYLFDHTSKDKTSYDSNRRSVYLPVIRNNLYDVFQLFDAPDPAVPNGDRATTTVPTQALFFLNSDLAARAADALAGRVLAGAKATDEDRVRTLFLLAYGRPPDARDVTRVTAGVAAFEAANTTETEASKRKRGAWAAVCQAVLASNEFIHSR